MSLTIRENTSDYSSSERAAIIKAYEALTVVAQEGNLTMEETRIRVAWRRLHAEENFKISQPTVKASTRKTKEVSFDDAMKLLSGETVTKPKRVSKKKEPVIKDDTIAKAARLNFLKMRGETLSPEEEEFLAIALGAPPEL